MRKGPKGGRGPCERASKPHELIPRVLGDRRGFYVFLDPAWSGKTPGRGRVRLLGGRDWALSPMSPRPSHKAESFGKRLLSQADLEAAM